MSNLIPLVDLSSNLWRKVRDRWTRKLNDKKNSAGESDWLAERPENWYQGPLIFPSIPEERAEETWNRVTEARQDQYEEAWSD